MRRKNEIMNSMSKQAGSFALYQITEVLIDIRDNLIDIRDKMYETKS